MFALCQSSFRPLPGLVSVPLAGTPLRWRHPLGWRADFPASRFADRMTGYATAAHADAVARNPRHAHWLRQQPRFGVQQLAPA